MRQVNPSHLTLISLFKQLNITASGTHSITGSNTLTLVGASWAKILAMNSSGVDLTFSCNVTFDNPNDVSRDFQLGKDSQNANTVTFAQNYTLTLADHLDFTFLLIVVKLLVQDPNIK